MALSVRKAIEDAIIVQLGDLVTGGKVRTVRPYSGELAKGEAEDVMKALNGLAPGILVSTTHGGYRGIAVNRRRVRRDIDIPLYLVNVSQSSPEDRVRGDGGIYELEDLVLERLTGVKLDLGAVVVPIGHLEPIAVEVKAHDTNACIWVQTWRITVEAEQRDAPAPNVTQVVGSLNAPSEQDSAGNPIVQVSNLITA